MSSPIRIAPATLFPILAALLLILQAGCGYRNTAHGPVVLPEDRRTLFIEEIENPTLMTSLDYRLRSLVRDELSRRGNIRWVVAGEASSVMQIEILTFTSSVTVTGSEDQTLRSAAVIVINGTILSAADRSVLWTSGNVSARESFVSGGEEDAEDRVIQLAVQRLVDRLAQNY